MTKQPLFISFSSQKGGVGKSAVTALTASYFHYSMGYNIAVLDCDFPQHSLAQMRERDMKIVMQSERYKRLAYEQFSTLNKKAYPIITCIADEALKEAEELISSSTVPYDIILFDLPGTVNSAGILSTMMRMNYIFTPLIADRVVLESSLSFINVVNEMLIKQGKTEIRGLHLFWNLVDGREKTDLYSVYEKIINELDLSIMKTFLSDSKRYRKELSETDNRPIFRSTVFPADKRLAKTTRLDAFVLEFLQIIKL